jgi:hypothetical protein
VAKQLDEFQVHNIMEGLAAEAAGKPVFRPGDYEALTAEERADRQEGFLDRVGRALQATYPSLVFGPELLRAKAKRFVEAAAEESISVVDRG